jgi:hypothetical protein
MFITKEVLTLEAQHHLDVDSPNSLEVYVSSIFDGLNFCCRDLTPLVVNFT